MQRLVATIGTQLLELVMGIEHEGGSAEPARRTRSTRVQAYHEIGDAVHTDAKIGRRRIMRNILGPFHTALTVNLVQALQPVPERGFERPLVHDRRTVKSADKCLERHGFRVKLIAEAA